jgi:hypothetical protein
MINSSESLQRASWQELKKGDTIYLQIVNVPSDRYFGPYEVADPDLGRIKVTFGYEINMSLANTQPYLCPV